MTSVGQGRIHLYDPVAKYLPEWADMTVINADFDSVGPDYNPKLADPSHYTKRQVRIIDCMSMSAGLTYDFGSEAIVELLARNPEATTREVIAAIAKMPLLYEPGTRYRYSLGHDVIGAVIEVVSGERLGEYLKNHVFGPLGVTELTMHLTDEEKKHLAAMYTYENSTGKIVPREMGDGFRIGSNFESGGASLAVVYPNTNSLSAATGDEFTVTLAPKGFGSENMSAMRMFTPAATRENIEDWIVSCVDVAGSNPCPPVIVGVGIGGTIEQCALEAKKALLSPMDRPNEDPYYADMERSTLEKINALGIGPQGMGGRITALGVHIRPTATHIAGLPCVVNMSCHVTRHATGSI